MNEEKSQRNELLGAFRQAWADMVVDSEDEPDIALIAAYVDGRLEEAETRVSAGTFATVRKLGRSWKACCPRTGPCRCRGRKTSLRAKPQTLFPPRAWRTERPIRAGRAGVGGTWPWPWAGWQPSTCGCGLWWANTAIRHQLAKNDAAELRSPSLQPSSAATCIATGSGGRRSVGSNRGGTRRIFAIRATPSVVRAATLSQLKNRGAEEPPRRAGPDRPALGLDPRSGGPSGIAGRGRRQPASAADRSEQSDHGGRCEGSQGRGPVLIELERVFPAARSATPAWRLRCRCQCTAG